MTRSGLVAPAPCPQPWHFFSPFPMPSSHPPCHHLVLRAIISSPVPSSRPLCHHLILLAILSGQESCQQFILLHSAARKKKNKKLLARNVTTRNLFVALFFFFCFNNSALFGAVALPRSLRFRAFICSCLVRAVCLAPRTHALQSPSHSFSLYAPLLPAPARFKHAVDLVSALWLPKKGREMPKYAIWGAKLPASFAMAPEH